LNKVEVTRFVKPLSQLLSWGIIVAAGLSSLATIGVDVTPMLTLGSVSTVAIGFAAQSTIANLVSALALYTSRTFIAGDRVQFKSMSGSTVVSGTVQDIRPMRTLVKCDNGSLVYVNNKDLATSLMVVNESELSKARLSSSIPVLETVLTIQYKYIDHVRDIVKHIDEYMKSHPKLDPSLKRTCYLQGFCGEGPQLYIKGTLAREYAAQDAQVFTEIMLAVERIVRENGAFLYIKRDQELPPALQGT
jgi:small-conductance mechanosensitive channel